VGDLLDSAHKLALAEVKPSQFVIGGHYDGTTVTGGIAFQRSWQNGYGLTAYLKAYWNDLPVTVERKHQIVAGVEFVKRF